MEEQVISISEIIDAVKKRWKIIALCTLIATLLSGIFSFFIIAPTYEASTKIFIGKEGAESEGYNSSDVSMYQNLLKTYSELIKTKDLVNRAIDNSEYDLSINNALSSISVNTVTGTQILQISYKSKSASIAKNMLENVTKEFINKAQELVPNGNVQVLEHVDDPIALVNELQRTATRGYLEVPSFIGESLFPKKSHKWVCLEINGKLVLFDKAKLPSLFPDYGKTFLNFLPYESISLRIFYLAYHQITTVRYEWKDSIDILVNPDDPYYRAFFEQDWSDEMIRTIFPYRDKKKDLQITISAFFHLVKTLVKRKMQRQSPITLEEYLKRTNQTL